MLTTEDVIGQEKLLAGFVPFVEIAIEVKQLPFYHQIAFFCSCYERILPIYMLVDGNDGWCDISILRSVGDNLWGITGGIDIQEKTIVNLINKANEIFIEDNDKSISDDGEIRQGLYVDLGEEVSRFAKLLLKYIDTKLVSDYFEIFVRITFLIYEYLDMYFANIDPDWEFKKTMYDKKDIAINNLLMQSELNKELADLEILKHTSDLTPEILSIFRANACPNGVGILGSLDKVRADLEGL